MRDEVVVKGGLNGWESFSGGIVYAIRSRKLDRLLYQSLPSAKYFSYTMLVKKGAPKPQPLPVRILAYIISPKTLEEQPELILSNITRNAADEDSSVVRAGDSITVKDPGWLW